MGRRLWYQDSYGNWHRDRQAERGSGSGRMPGAARVALYVLLLLAALVVLASLTHAPAPAAHP